MNNKLEVIGIDHGWSMMKTVTQVFVTGVKEITTTPALFGDVLEYDGKYYKIGTVRQEVKDTKVEDDSFYLLTLAAVAKELKKRGLSDTEWLEEHRKWKTMPSLTRNVVVSLIQSVKVYEGGDIEIVLDCDDEYRKIVARAGELERQYDAERLVV